MPKWTTPAQLFARIFAVWVDKNAPQAERDNAERKLDAWLKRHSKTRADISAILIQAAAEDAAAQPPPPPSDPRDGAPHPFDSPEFTPAGLVEGILTKYLTMKPWVSVIYSLYICFTHVFTRFRIVPRVVFTSGYPDSGKTTGLDVGWNLMFRPNPEALGTGAAVRDFLDEGPGTVSLDELDQLDAEARRALLLIWNLGHKRGAKYSLMIGGEKKLINLCAPMIMAGVGKFLGTTQMSRAFKLEWEPYTEETRPERKYDDEDVSDLNAVYSFLRNWACESEAQSQPTNAAGSAAPIRRQCAPPACDRRQLRPGMGPARPRGGNIPARKGEG